MGPELSLGPILFQVNFVQGLISAFGYRELIQSLWITTKALMSGLVKVDFILRVSSPTFAPMEDPNESPV